MVLRIRLPLQGMQVQCLVREDPTCLRVTKPQCSQISKESANNAGDPGLIPGSGRSPGEGNGYPLQYSCQENPKDRGAWRATVHGVTKSQTELSK